MASRRKPLQHRSRRGLRTARTASAESCTWHSHSVADGDPCLPLQLRLTAKLAAALAALGAAVDVAEATAAAEVLADGMPETLPASEPPGPR